MRLVDRPDVVVLKAIADQGCVDILRSLLAGPATQKQLQAEHGINSGTLSRRMRELEQIGLVERERSHGPYQLVFGEQIRTLVQAAADLGQLGMQRRADEATAYARDLRKEAFSGGRRLSREDLA